jgi:hypothetical protein
MEAQTCHDMATQIKRKYEGTVQGCEDEIEIKRICDHTADNVLADSENYMNAVFSSKSTPTQAVVHASSELLPIEQTQDNTSNQMMNMMRQLTTDVRKMCVRMDGIADEIESKLSAKFGQMLDKRINTEVSKLRKTIDVEVTRVKDDFRADIKNLQDQVDELPTATANSDDIGLNVVVRNLPKSNNESLESKVVALFRKGMNLKDVGIRRVVRKEGRPTGKPGVVIITCRTQDERQAILRNKRKLRESRRYSVIFIHPDQSYESRLQATNFRTLLSALGSDTRDLRLQGSRLVVGSSATRGGHVDGNRAENCRPNRDPRPPHLQDRANGDRKNNGKGGNFAGQRLSGSGNHGDTSNRGRRGQHDSSRDKKPWQG